MQVDIKTLELLVKNVMTKDIAEIEETDDQAEDPDVRQEKAVQLRKQRAGQFGDVRKKFHVAKELLNTKLYKHSNNQSRHAEL